MDTISHYAVTIGKFLHEQMMWLFSGAGILAVGYLTAWLKKYMRKPHAVDEPVEYVSNYVHTTLDIKRYDGSDAELRKRQEITFCKDGMAELTDVIACAGSSQISKTENIIFLDVKNHMGSIAVQRFKLPRIPKKGDRHVYSIDRRIIDALALDSEYWELEISRPTELFILEILFPASRHYASYRGVVRNQYRSRIAGTQPFGIMLGERHVLRWEVVNPEVGGTYRIEWDW